VSSMNMTLVVAGKEMKNIIRNKGLLFGGLWIGGTFGVLNVLLSGQVFLFDNSVFSVALLVGVFVGFMFSAKVFLREKREKVIETMLCTPLSLKSIWFGKVLGATIPAYLFSLLSVTLVIIISNIILHSLLFPSVAILTHILGVVPVFIASAISLIGFCQFLLGMRENKIISYLIILVLFPFIYPSIFSGLIQGNMNVVVSWPEVVVCLIVSVFLLSLTTYLSRYLSKEKIILTIP
jgi:ABC-2 type transport system permease protein